MPTAAGVSRPFPRRRTAGSVILLVLVTVLLASFLLTKFVTRAGTELLADARAGDRARLRREAYSALETTLAVLADVRAIDHGLHSPAQGWDRPLDYAGYTPGAGLAVDVVIEDESGKISLPRADLPTLEALLVGLGLDQAGAGRAAEALLVWTRADYVPASLEADGSHYERAAIPYQPAGRPLRSFGELAAVEVVRELFFDEAGRPTQLARDFQASASLYSFDRVNLNAAPATVLAAGGLGVGQIDALADHARRQKAGDGTGFLRSTSDAAALLGANAPLEKFGAEVRALHLTVTVRGGTLVYRLSAVVAPPGGATIAVAPPLKTAVTTVTAGAPPQTAADVIKKLDYPFKVLEIREDVESPDTQPADPTAHD
jgi:type II secretory pathway component PulK